MADGICIHIQMDSNVWIFINVYIIYMHTYCTNSADQKMYAYIHLSIHIDTHTSKCPHKDTLHRTQCPCVVDTRTRHVAVTGFDPLVKMHISRLVSVIVVPSPLGVFINAPLCRVTYPFHELLLVNKPRFVLVNLVNYYPASPQMKKGWFAWSNDTMHREQQYSSSMILWLDCAYENCRQSL